MPTTSKTSSMPGTRTPMSTTSTLRTSGMSNGTMMRDLMRSLQNKQNKSSPKQPTPMRTMATSTKEKESPDPQRWDLAALSVAPNGTTPTAARSPSRRARVPAKATTDQKARASTKAMGSFHTGKVLESPKDMERKASTQRRASARKEAFGVTSFRRTSLTTMVDPIS